MTVFFASYEEGKNIPMGRGRNSRQPIVDPDTACVDQRYWEKVLVSHGLGMGRGLAAQLSYVGSDSSLVGMEERLAGERQGQEHAYVQIKGILVYRGGRKVVPQGQGPDSESDDD